MSLDQELKPISEKMWAELAVLEATSEEGLRRDKESKLLGHLIADEQRERLVGNGWTQLWHDGHDGVVASTTVPEQVPVLREAMQYAGKLLYDSLQIDSQINESNNGSKDDPQTEPPTIWHLSLDSTWRAR